jgi:hypothetical protein
MIDDCYTQIMAFFVHRAYGELLPRNLDNSLNRFAQELKKTLTSKASQ